MALGTVSIVKQGVMGDLQYRIVDINVSSGANYTTNGETVLPSQVGLTTIYDCTSEVSVAGRVSTYDYVNQKFLVYQDGNAVQAMQQVPGNTDLSGATQTFRFFIRGK